MAAPALLAQSGPVESGFDQTFYVDASFTGGTQTGTPEAPFTSLGTAFAEIAQRPHESLRLLVDETAAEIRLFPMAGVDPAGVKLLRYDDLLITDSIFRGNFGDNQFNGGILVAHTQTPESTQDWFGLYSADTYTGSGNRFHITTPGTYTLTLRYWSDETVTMPGLLVNAESLSPVHPLPATNGRWRWAHGPEVVLTPGTHTLAIERPASALALDRILLANTVSALPPAGSTDTGPAESPMGLPLLESPDPYATWLATHFTPAQLADDSLRSNLWGPKADPDKDGIPNLLEFVLGGHPLIPGTASSLALDIVQENGQAYLRLSVVRNPEAGGIPLRVETTANPGTAEWSSGDGHTFTEVDSSTLLRVRDGVPLLPGASRFMRLTAGTEN